MSKIVRTKTPGEAWATTVEPEGGGSGDSGIQVATINMSAADIHANGDAPFELLPAPGPGLAVVPLHAIWIFTPDPNGIVVYLGGVFYASNLAGTRQILPPPSNNPDTALLALSAGSSGVTPAEAEDSAVVMASDIDNHVGQIATSSVNAPGSGYAGGDTFNLTFSDTGYDGAGEVDTVDGGGGVLTFHLTDNGNAYLVGDAVPTEATSGDGSGLVIDVDTVTQADASLFAYIYYVIVPV